jgi:multidrug efflux pump subunit AcrB
MNLNLRAAQGTAFGDMMAYARRVGEIIQQNQYVDMAMVSSGGGMGTMNTARVNIQLKPRADRPLTAAQIVAELRPRISRFPGFQPFLNPPPAISIGAGCRTARISSWSRASMPTNSTPRRLCTRTWRRCSPPASRLALDNARRNL